MRVAGKLFVIEGTDGSGKSTQFALLCRALSDRGVRFRAVTFPRYSEDSSVPVRLYLSGKLGERPDDVGPYAASSFFAIDRYISYKTDWMRDYQAGVPILCDRYTTSNAVHQAAKLSGDERDRYLDWLFDYEYRLLGIPAPDEVFFLDMPSELALDLAPAAGGKWRHPRKRPCLSVALPRERAVCMPPFRMDGRSVRRAGEAAAAGTDRRADCRAGAPAPGGAGRSFTQRTCTDT